MTNIGVIIGVKVELWFGFGFRFGVNVKLNVGFRVTEDCGPSVAQCSFSTLRFNSIHYCFCFSETEQAFAEVCILCCKVLAQLHIILSNTLPTVFNRQIN